MAEQGSHMKQPAGGLAGTETEQTSAVTSTGAGGAKDIAGEAVSQAGVVVGEAKTQMRDLVGSAGGELQSQGDAQTERLAEGLRTVAGQFQAMLDGRTSEAGPLPDLARQASEHLQSLAGRLGDGGVQGLANDVQRFARRRPGTFLVGAAALGFAAGRLVKGAQAGTETSSPSAGSHMPTAPVAAGMDEDFVRTRVDDDVDLREQATAAGAVGGTSTPLPGEMVP